MQTALSDPGETLNVLWVNLENILDLAVTLFKRGNISAQTVYYFFLKERQNKEPVIVLHHIQIMYKFDTLNK